MGGRVGHGKCLGERAESSGLHMAAPPPSAMAMCQACQSGGDGAQIPFPGLLGNLWNPLGASPPHPPSLSDQHQLSSHASASSLDSSLDGLRIAEPVQATAEARRISDAREVPAAGCEAKTSQLLQHTPTSPPLLDTSVRRGRKASMEGGRGQQGSGCGGGMWWKSGGSLSRLQGFASRAGGGVGL